MTHPFQPLLLSFKSLGDAKDVASLHAFADLIKQKHLSCPPFQSREEGQILFLALHTWSTYLKGWSTDSFSKNIDKKTQEALGLIVGEMLQTNLSHFFSVKDWDDLWAHAFRISSPALWKNIAQYKSPNWDKFEEPFINHDGREDAVFSTLQWALRLEKVDLLDFAKSHGWTPCSDELWKDAWGEKSLRWLVNQGYTPPQDPTIALSLMTAPRTTSTKLSPIRRRAYSTFVKLFPEHLNRQKAMEAMGSLLFKQGWQDFDALLKIHTISPNDPALLQSIMNYVRTGTEISYSPALYAWSENLSNTFHTPLKNGIPFGYQLIWETPRIREKWNRHLFGYDFFNKSWLSSFKLPELYPMFQTLQKEIPTLSSREALNATAKSFGLKWIEEQPKDALRWAINAEFEIESISLSENKNESSLPGLELLVQELNSMGGVGVLERENWDDSDKTLWCWALWMMNSNSRYYGSLSLKNEFPKMLEREWPKGDDEITSWLWNEVKHLFSLEEQAQLEAKRLHKALPQSSSSKPSLRL